MIKRINALRIVFNFLLSIVELLIGVHFLLNIFGSTETSLGILETVKTTLEQMGAVSSGILHESSMQRPVAALLLVLGFMLMSLVLITMVPAMVIKKEKELECLEDTMLEND